MLFPKHSCILDSSSPRELLQERYFVPRAYEPRVAFRPSQRTGPRGPRCRGDAKGATDRRPAARHVMGGKGRGQSLRRAGLPFPLSLPAVAGPGCPRGLVPAPGLYQKRPVQPQPRAEGGRFHTHPAPAPPAAAPAARPPRLILVRRGRPDTQRRGSR